MQKYNVRPVRPTKGVHTNHHDPWFYYDVQQCKKGDVNAFSSM